VVEIGELDKSMLRFFGKLQMCGFEPARLKRTGLREQPERGQNTRSANEFAPAELPWFCLCHSAPSV
jgi:hypothetical protein